MNNKFNRTNIKIKYKDDIEAKKQFINFLVDYFLDKEINRKKGSGTL